MITGYPEEISEEMNQINLSCSNYRIDCVILPSLKQDETLRRIGASKSDIISCITQLSSLIHHNLKIANKFDMAKKLKFDEDLGEVLKKMNEIDALKGSNSKNYFMTAYDCKISLDTAFEFVVYRPIIMVNSEKIKKVEDYVKKLFNLCQSNCSIIAHTEREESGSSRKASPTLSASSIALLNEYPEEKKDIPTEDDDTEDKENNSSKKVGGKIRRRNV